eukprot:TRINITY_DN79923_c0_g1_i1.p1 TRINITY_DN79923_c0_g1~~TRINITY_DN79923_c0_g1_i1.p1  ORF type:complete len:542 (+),score=98.51 TRINITY_DN79923_c0_g1_i1:45-1628(+)
MPNGVKLTIFAAVGVMLLIRWTALALCLMGLALILNSEELNYNLALWSLSNKLRSLRKRVTGGTGTELVQLVIQLPKQLTKKHINSVVFQNFPPGVGRLEILDQNLTHLRDEVLERWSVGVASSIKSVHIDSCTLDRNFFSCFAALQSLKYLKLSKSCSFGEDEFGPLMEHLSNSKTLISLKIDFIDDSVSYKYVKFVDKVCKFVSTRPDPHLTELTFGCKIPVSDIVNPSQRTLTFRSEPLLSTLGQFEARLVERLITRFDSKFELLRLLRVTFGDESLRNLLSARVSDSLLAIEVDSDNMMVVSSFQRTVAQLSSNKDCLPRLVRVSRNAVDDPLVNDALISRNRTVKCSKKIEARMDKKGLMVIQPSGIFVGKKETRFPWKDVSLTFDEDATHGCFQTPAGPIQTQLDSLEIGKRLAYLTQEPDHEIAKLLNSFHWLVCEKISVSTPSVPGFNAEEEKSASMQGAPLYAQLIKYELELRQIINKFGFDDLTISEHDSRLQKFLSIQSAAQPPAQPPSYWDSLDQ